MKQLITYGGLLGQYYQLGLRPYLQAFAIYWAMLNSIKELKVENDALKAELAERDKALEERIAQLEAAMAKL